MKMKSKKVIIIGAGIAGMSAGCYLQMNGYETEIFESHGSPGGLCTSWKRKGYTIDGCIHGLVGSNPSHPWYALWDEIIDMDEIQFYNSPVTRGIVCKNGQIFYEYSDLNALQNYMEQISPEDKKPIRDFIKGIRKLKKINVFDLMGKKPREFFNVWDYLKMLKLLPGLFTMKKWFNVSLADFGDRFINPFLKEAVSQFASPVLFEMLVLSEMDQKRSGYPIGGSLYFSKLLEKSYLELGGKIHYNVQVVKINVISDEESQTDRATGITLETGELYEADIVISASDGYTTIFKMLDGKYVDQEILNLYEEMDLNPSRVLIHLGVNKKLKDLPDTIKLVLETPYKLADGSFFEALDIRVFNFDPTLTPEGKTLIEVALEIKNYDFWAKLRTEDRNAYRDLKEKIAKDIIEILSDCLVDIKMSVEMVDVATPATFNRYTNNLHGSIQGWANENIFAMKKVKKELPNLGNFYMIGHWVQPGGGVPTAFLSGRHVTQIICKRDKKKFQTEKIGNSVSIQAPECEVSSEIFL